MSDQHTANIKITNNTGGMALIYLFHEIKDEVLDKGRWPAASGETVGPLTVHYDTGAGSHLYDWWSVLVNVLGGPNAGFYVNAGGYYPPWIEDPLGGGDDDQTYTFTVSTTEFTINLANGTENNPMTKIGPKASRVSHVFVVMLENRSFDHVFAMSGIQGIAAASLGNFNEYKNKQYLVQKGAPLSLPTDPGHEFHDTVEQLCGEGKQNDWKPGGPFPPINNSGFVANYATTTDELTGLPPESAWGDVMRCFDTPTQLPVLYQLATEFAICDQWYSSLPGLTWPNRFFVHGASSSGMDKNPATKQILKWESVAGFQYQNGSIYDALNRAGVPYRFYIDSTAGNLSIYSDAPQKGSVFGAVAQVTSIANVHHKEINSLEQFSADLQGPYPYLYTFIEPHYGDVWGNTYEGGSSQHPMDDVYGGEHLLAAVYAAIRQSPYWESSVLIVTYDEHGGLYDHLPPPAAVPPGDSNPPVNYNVNGFPFDRLGIRVPAVVVSPLIPKNSVDHTVYDHSSVPKTVETLFGLLPLTHRDEAAKDVVHLLSLPEPRADCPMTLNNPAPVSASARPTVSADQQAAFTALPMPDEGNFAGALSNLVKADVELSGGTPEEIAAIKARFEAITTRGQAHAYAVEVTERVNRIKEGLRRAMRSGPDRAADTPAGS